MGYLFWNICANVRYEINWKLNNLACAKLNSFFFKSKIQTNTNLSVSTMNDRQNLQWSQIITSSDGNIFRVTGLCEGNPPVNSWFSPQRPVTRSFDVFFDLRLNKRLNAGDLRLHRAHYGVTVMIQCYCHFMKLGHHNRNNWNARIATKPTMPFWWHRSLS